MLCNVVFFAWLSDIQCLILGCGATLVVVGLGLQCVLCGQASCDEGDDGTSEGTSEESEENLVGWFPGGYDKFWPK